MFRRQYLYDPGWGRISYVNRYAQSMNRQVRENTHGQGTYESALTSPVLGKCQSKGQQDTISHSYDSGGGTDIVQGIPGGDVERQGKLRFAGGSASAHHHAGGQLTRPEQAPLLAYRSPKWEYPDVCFQRKTSETRGCEQMNLGTFTPWNPLLQLKWTNYIVSTMLLNGKKRSAEGYTRYYLYTVYRRRNAEREFTFFGMHTYVTVEICGND